MHFHDAICKSAKAAATSAAPNHDQAVPAQNDDVTMDQNPGTTAGRDVPPHLRSALLSMPAGSIQAKHLCSRAERAVDWPSLGVVHDAYGLCSNIAQVTDHRVPTN